MYKSAFHHFDGSPYHNHNPLIQETYASAHFSPRTYTTTLPIPNPRRPILDPSYHRLSKMSSSERPPASDSTTIIQFTPKPNSKTSSLSSLDTTSTAAAPETYYPGQSEKRCPNCRLKGPHTCRPARKPPALERTNPWDRERLGEMLPQGDGRD